MSPSRSIAPSAMFGRNFTNAASVCRALNRKCGFRRARIASKRAAAASASARAIEIKLPIRTVENRSRVNDMATKSHIAKNGSHAAKAMAQRLIRLRTISPRISQVLLPSWPFTERISRFTENVWPEGARRLNCGTEEKNGDPDDQRSTDVTLDFKDPIAPSIRYSRACRRNSTGVDGYRC